MSTYPSTLGGVCAPLGFSANGIACGIRKNKEKKDLALIVSSVPCRGAAVYTTNKVYGAPLTVTREHLKNGMAQAILCNSGNANTCNADGVEKATAMAQLAGEALGLSPEDVLVASTGVIGEVLDLAPIQKGIAPLAAGLCKEGAHDAAQAIMTTDTHPKEAAVTVVLGGKTCTLGAMAKGSGMIHPNMATMLSFMTTDADISAPLLQKALSAVVQDTFNMISVDGDTSTNDMVCLLANGLAGNPTITEEGPDYNAFVGALRQVSTTLARMMAKDGEGATKLLECTVTGAPCKETAKKVAKSVITSSLLKSAMFGEDANWGRILCAIGYTDADFSIDTISVDLASCKGQVAVCRAGAGVPFSEEKAAEVLHEDEIQILIHMGQGQGSATAWGCDLTYDYVKINGDYRT